MRPVRAGGVALLLTLWGDRCARGELAIDLAAARVWFAGQRRCGAQLVQVLESSCNAQRRRMCLLALCVARDPASEAVLLRVAEGRRHEEAMLAGCALGWLPDHGSGLAARRFERNDHLRLGALLSRGNAAVRALLATELERRGYGLDRAMWEEPLDEASFRAVVTLLRRGDWQLDVSDD